jgi:hypothetical protein
LRSIAQNDNQDRKEIDMAKVSQVSNSFVFTNLSAVGEDLVNEFVRKYTQMKHEGITPGHRTIEWTTPEEETILKELAKKVEASDPE